MKNNQSPRGSRRAIPNAAFGLSAAFVLSFAFVSCSPSDSGNPASTDGLAQNGQPKQNSATHTFIDVKGQLGFSPDQRLVAASNNLAKDIANPDASFQRDEALEARVARTKVVQEKHTGTLMQMHGVIGTGVGIERDGTTSLMILARAADVKNIPATIDGEKVRVEVVGDIKPMTGVYTGYYRPVPCGVSIGNNNENSAGTLGCALNINGYAYMLSNNHVMARQNAASLGESIGQPGPYDNGGYVSPQVAVLSGFNRISYTSNNSFDAAVAQYTTNGYASMISGYTPSHTTYTPTVGMYVKKTGRTTGLTHGQISAVNVTIQVGYNGGNATFTNQIYIASGSFINAGDSGSLLVTESGNHPVGLCFAGSSTASFANPIQPILTYFGGTVIGY